MLKDNKTVEARSKCCGKPVSVAGEENFVDGVDYGTHFHACSQCGEQCDVMDYNETDRFAE